ncbi:hypothetical protein FOPE_06700 [Fonsecaea pedrosoi]|nr:hypothetical protein FOPE_06700 [Fonsecaea pedrosoi]
MTETLAPYAVACSRGQPSCQRCEEEATACSYSRSGLIRRNRQKRKHASSVSDQSTSSAVTGSRAGEVAPNNLQSSLATDIDATQERLHGLGASRQNSLGALSSLAQTSAAVWQDSLELGKAARTFFLFKDRAVSWVNTFEAELKRDRPCCLTPPPEVLGHLRASCPEKVRDRAWLVMYYGIILNLVSETDPVDESTKSKLRSNLMLALNDARLHLEPSEVNIQALLLLALDVEEFTTPTLCWMMVTNACRMLQALGVNHRRFDSPTRDRRVMMFWHLYLVDIGLALIFGRSPAFHRGMPMGIPVPTVKRIFSSQQDTDPSDTPALFGVHYINRMFLLSLIMGDIWYYLHEDPMPDYTNIESTSESLESWYLSTIQILEAASLTEKPLLAAKDAAAIDLALRNVSFQYEYLYILLARSSPRMRVQCTESSKRMLCLLEKMGSDESQGSANSMVWHLLCAPFTPFLDLFGELISNGAGGSDENRAALAAMEHLPVFLGKMSSRNSLAAKLKSIAEVLVQHAQLVVNPQDHNTANPVVPPFLAEPVSDHWPNALSWDSFFNYNMHSSDLNYNPQTENVGAEPTDLTAWTNDFFDNAFVDWTGWKPRV